MTGGECRAIIAVVLAVAVPALGLHWAAGSERWEWGLTAAPFAWLRLLVSHLITALPLGFVLARWLRSLPAVNEVAATVWLGSGVGMVGLVAAISAGLAEAIAAGTFGSGPLLVLRVLLAVVFVLPWCLAALPPRTEPMLHFNGVCAVAIAFAVIPCAVYAEALIPARTQAAEEWMASGRYVKAERELVGLVELGSERPVAQKPPAELLMLVRKEIERLQRSVAYPLPATASVRAKLARAEALIQLEQLDEAAGILEPLTATDVNAVLLLAVVNRDRQRWSESDTHYRTALEQLLPWVEVDPIARERACLAFEGLAYNARQQRRQGEVEQILQQAITRLPTDAARFHFLLGQHYASTGRPLRAINHLQQAIEFDPVKHHDAATELIRQLQSSTPSCLIR